MRFQTAMASGFAEKVFRSVKNCYTKTLTASSFVAGAPVVLATATASIDGCYAQYPATSTSIVNNFYLGNADAAISPEGVGLVQCYGYDDDAVVQVLTDTQAVGVPLLCEASFLFNSGGLYVPYVAASTGTSAHLAYGGAGGLVFLAETIATSSATDTGAKKVFIRAM